MKPTPESCETMAFKRVIKATKDEPNSTWTLMELHVSYLTKGGGEITEEMKSDIYVFKSMGLSPLTMHKKKASSMFNLVKTQDEDYNTDHTDVKSISKKFLKS